MGFLVPAFLAGFLAIAVPVVLHLRHRDKDRPFKFPSLMFLEQLPIRTAQRRRVTDWPLLLLRALALALLALAFSRPLLKQRSLASADSRARAVVVLLDRSMSMGHRDVWPAALDSARRIIGALGERDRVGVVFFDDASEIAQRLTEDKAAAIGVLGAAKPLERGTRFAPALRTARQMLLDAPYAAAEIVVISDLQRAGTTGVAGIDLPSGVTLRAVNVGAVSRANSGVRAVEARRVVDNTGGAPRTLLAVKARVSSRDLVTVRTARATLVVNGRDAGSQTTTLTNGESVVTFAPVPAPESDVAAQVRLESDALAGDDTFRFVVPRDDAVRVALILPGDVGAEETMFMERALTIGRAPEIVVTRRRGGALDAATARDASVLLFWDTPTAMVNSTTLRDFLARGGGVAVVAGRRLAASTRENSANVNTILPARFVGLADRLNDRGGTLTALRLEHPLFAPFRETDDAFTATRFLRYPRLEATAGSDVLARFDDGLPAIVERKSGGGRVLLLATSLDAASSDFPLQPAFLPFLRQLVMHVSGRDATPLWHATAANWAIPEGITDAVVRAPDESLLRPRADSTGAAVPLADAGFYAAFAGSASGLPRAMVGVNPPASESDLTPVDPKELLLGVGTSENLAAADSVPQTPDALERRQNLWRILLVLVALALLGETFMATRGWRAIARRFPSGRVADASPAVRDRSAA